MNHCPNALRRAMAVPAIFLLALLSGCTVHPPGEREERAAALHSGRPFQTPHERRLVAPLPEKPSADDLANYALTANADLEQRYWQWRSAIEQIPQDGTQTASLNIALGTTLNRGRTGLGSSTIMLANDPMTDIKWPGKLDLAARQALDNARAAGRRFRKAQFELRGRVLRAYDDYALSVEMIRLQESDLEDLRTIASLAEAAHRSGKGTQQDLLRSRDEVDLAQNELGALKARLGGQRATLNALLGRPVETTLPMPEGLPPSLPLGASDAQILAWIADRNPELQALAEEIRAQEEAVQLARLQYLPDFNLSAASDFQGIAQSAVGQFTVPLLRHEAIDAAIAQARANVSATRAMRRQSSSDLAARAALDLVTLHDSDRQIALFQNVIAPRARQILDLSQTAYAAGQANFTDMLAAHRSLIAIRRLVANLRTARAQSLADVEAVAAFDFPPPA